MRKIGARYLSDKKCEFIVWAPLLERLGVSIVTGQSSREIDLQRDESGYFSAIVDDVMPGSRYFYNIAGRLTPDPASYFQPEDVFGPSCVIDHEAFNWQDKNWKGVALKCMIIYELHIGTFTPEGTFESAEKRLDDLVDLGITAVEVMPVAQFPGARNWGYDGVYPFAVQHSYGGPEAFKKFIDACHRRGLAVILDVVYNHLGPEGNFLPQYMPVFTDKYRTPWGQAINFDEAHSDGIRNYFIQNALYWMEHYHIDALRLDAIHGIYDMGARHFLRELADAVEDFSSLKEKKFYLIAESDLNDRCIVLDSQRGGYKIDSQWSDDFHHAVHAVLTKENAGYYEDFGSIGHIAKVMKEGFVYTGEYSPFRKRSHGNTATDILSEKFVVCLQNHDQIGNRFKADRLSSLVSFDALKLAAGALIFSSYVPLIFMGEEYGEQAPFTYFMSFHDEKLIEAVRKGRRAEFASFGWTEEPLDPRSQETFARAKLNWHQRDEGNHQVLLSFYKKLFELRKTIPALANSNRDSMDIRIQDHVIIIKRYWNDNSIYMLMNFGQASAKITSDFQIGDKLLDSSDVQWQGTGSLLTQRIIPGEDLTINPLSFVLYQHI
jgi:maltooligosyltrehalose trehalohydrolase